MRRLPMYLLVVALLLLGGCKRKTAAMTDAGSADESSPSKAVVMPLLLADAGTPPLAGTVGADADGYPTQYVDSAALRAMLFRRDFAKLTKVFTDLQHDFEVDPKREHFSSDAAFSFGSHEAALGPLLDAWVAASPSSFAPYIARASHRTSVSFHRRGSALAKDTPAKKLDAMRESFALAKADIDKALSLRPKLVPAYAMRIQINRAMADDVLVERSLTSALQVCPSCFQVRVIYLKMSTPRWGGTYEEMAKLATKWASAGPKMKLLAGLVDLDKADQLESEDKYEAELAALERACAVGEYWMFLSERGAFHARHGDKTKALSDLNRALELRPGQTTVLSHRSFAFYKLQRFEEAARDLRSILLIDPEASDTRIALTPVVQELIKEGVRHRVAGRREDALRVFDLASELAPGSLDVARQRAAMLGDASAR